MVALTLKHEDLVNPRGTNPCPFIAVEKDRIMKVKKRKRELEADVAQRKRMYERGDRKWLQKVCET